MIVMNERAKLLTRSSWCIRLEVESVDGSGWGSYIPSGGSGNAMQEIRQQVMQTSEDGKLGWGVMQCGRGGGGVGELVMPSNELRSRLKPVSGEFFADDIVRG